LFHYKLPFHEVNDINDTSLVLLQNRAGKRGIFGIQLRILARELHQAREDKNENLKELNPFLYARNKNGGQKLRVD